MRKIWTKNIRMLLLVALSCILLAGCDSPLTNTAVQSNELGTGESQPVNAEVQSKAASTDGNDIVLHIAMFPYVPDVDYFEKAIQDAWDSDESHSNVKLEFSTDWDCYSGQGIPDEYDVVVFDALYLTEYAQGGELLKIDEADINNYDDILPFVREGMKVEGNTYGVPEMICANLFFYRPGDTEVENAENVDKLYEVMGSCEYSKAKPENNKGLLVDMTSGTGQVCLYLDSIIDTKAVYSDFTDLPDLDNINEAAIQSLNELVLMAGEKGAYYSSEDDYERAGWFGEGSGRAYIGYSESMARMGEYTSEVQIRTLSLADREDIPLFYTDVIAMNDNLQDDSEKKKYAMELLNIMADSDVMTNTISHDGNCQYILPARNSCYTALKEQFRVYEQLEKIALNPNNHVFRMGAGAHDYTEKAAERLKYYILGE